MTYMTYMTYIHTFHTYIQTFIHTYAYGGVKHKLRPYK